MNYNYSIIIPHRNIPDLLIRLLRTIPIREDLQVIVVDDCSDDKFELLLNRIKLEYNNVEFYSTEICGGGGKARNVGLRYAKGKFLIFADADDFFLPSFFEVLEENKNESFDLKIYRAIALNSDRYVLSNRVAHLDDYFRCYSRNENQGCLKLMYLFGEPWCKIINRRIVEKYQIRFDESIIHNDTKFSYLVSYYSVNVEVCDKAVYCVTDRLLSVSRIIDWERVFVRTEIFAQKNRFLIDKNIPVFDEYMLYPLWSAIISKDCKKIIRYFSVVEKYRFKWYSVLVKMLFMKMKNLCKRFVNK